MRRIVVRDLVLDAHGAPLTRNVVLRVLVPAAIQGDYADPNRQSITPDFTSAAELADLRAGKWIERLVALDARATTYQQQEAAALAALATAQKELDAAGPDAVFNYYYDDVAHTWNPPA